MQPIKSWSELVAVVHPWAVEKGWWENRNRPLDEQVANFHAEISEAWEEYREDRMGTWYSLGGKPFLKSGNNEAGCPVFCDGRDDSHTPVKPEGFWCEIGDLLVRLADTCGRHEVNPKGILAKAYSLGPGLSIPVLITRLHNLVTKIEDDAYGRLAEHSINTIGVIVNDCVLWSAEFGHDLWPTITEKMTYNWTRSHRHGGKRA